MSGVAHRKNKNSWDNSKSSLHDQFRKDCQSPQKSYLKSYRSWDWAMAPQKSPVLPLNEWTLYNDLWIDIIAA